VDIDADTDEPEFENEWLKNMDFSTQERDVVIKYLEMQGETAKRLRLDETDA